MNDASKIQTPAPPGDGRGTARSKRRKAAAVVILMMMGVAATDGDSFPANGSRTADTQDEYHELDGLLSDLAAGAESATDDNSSGTGDSPVSSANADAEISLTSTSFAPSLTSADAAGRQAPATVAAGAVTEEPDLSGPDTVHPVIRLTGTIEPLP